MRALSGMRVNSFTIKAETVIATEGSATIVADDIKNIESAIVLSTVNAAVIVTPLVDHSYTVTDTVLVPCTFHTLIVGHN